MCLDQSDARNIIESAMSFVAATRFNGIPSTSYRTKLLYLAKHKNVSTPFLINSLTMILAPVNCVCEEFLFYFIAVLTDFFILKSKKPLFVSVNNGFLPNKVMLEKHLF